MAKRGPKPKKTEFYVDPVELKDLLKSYYKTNKGEDGLAVMLVKIAEGLSHSGNFCSYTYKGDMIGDALVKMFAAVKNRKFNVESDSNPFSYFTTIAFHAFINRIKKEKKHHDTINNYREKFFVEEMIQACEDSGVDVYIRPTDEDEDDFANE